MFRPLSGGFGKQTFLFATQGTGLSGDFVMRRDLAEPVVDNDCHRIQTEYQMIQAAHAHGFPAPEALWLDLEHALLPGGNFLVMRRAPGVPGGSVFQAKGKVPEDLAQTLAEILARLHALPPMTELSALSESVNTGRWGQSLDQCVKGYLEDYWSLFQREIHLPSPALASMFGWLLSNIPAMSGPPVLLHGDIGFHNFLFDDGHLSAVLDWEFAHLGDPAEDLAYVRNTVGPALDWEAFMAAYQAAGGSPVSAERLQFFQVWGHVRNACCSNLITAKFAAGLVDDLKLVVLPHAYIPQFLGAAQSLIEQGPA
jgi:aminoglycoside phosphotransferase (APT) family kinase protein